VQPKLATITVTGCHLIPVILRRRDRQPQRRARALAGASASSCAAFLRGTSVIEPEWPSLDDSSVSFRRVFPHRKGNYGPNAKAWARGRLGDYFAEVLLLDQGTDAARARAELGWYPSHPSLSDDFRHGSLP
jgi:hypothetical protein